MLTKEQIKHDILCIKIANQMMKNYYDSKIVDSVLELMQKPLANRENHGIIEERYNDGSHYTKDEHGRFTGSTSSGGGSSSSGSSSGTGTGKSPHLQAKLTGDEEAALNAYISSESYKINEKLRSNIKLNDSEQKIADNLDSALDKMPKYEGTVYRSLGSDMMEDVNGFWKQHHPGNIVRYGAYTSSSLEVYDETMDIQCVILSKNGRNITSYNANEQEVLFIRNSDFLVTNIEDNKIFLEEV